MSDYSEVLYLMAAMLAFSMLSTNISRSFLMTTETMLRSGAENRAINLAQDEIERVKLISRDSENSLKSSHNAYIYDDYPKTITKTYGRENQYSESYQVQVVSALITEPDPLLNRYLVTVRVSNNGVKNPVAVELNFIKSFEK